MLLTLLALSAWHWPTPEQVLYPTTEARLQACLTAKATPTAADLKQAREAASKRMIYFVPPVNSLAGACLPPDDRYPAVVKAAGEFKTTLQNGTAPPASLVVTLMGPIKEYNDARGWMATLVLKDSTGKVIKRWKPRTGMVRQLVPSSGLSILIFDAPREAERPLVRKATQLLVEVDWGQGQMKQVVETRNLPTY